MKRKLRYTSALATARKAYTAGLASRIIRPANEEIKPGDLTLIVCRVSRRQYKGNLDNHEAAMRRAVAKLGAEVIDVIRYVGSGWDPWWLCRAVRAVETYRNDHALDRDIPIKIVAESTDRLVRNQMYHSNSSPDAQATDTELDELAEITNGYILTTILHPDSTPTEIRSYQRRRGQQEKGRKGGRPQAREPGYKKRRRAMQFPRVLELFNNGCTYRHIAMATGVPQNTAHYWIKNWLKDRQ